MLEINNSINIEVNRNGLNSETESLSENENSSINKIVSLSFNRTSEVPIPIDITLPNLPNHKNNSNKENNHNNVIDSNKNDINNNINNNPSGILYIIYNYL